MEKQKVVIDLYSDEKAEGAFAIRLNSDTAGWRAEKGFGADFKKIWSVDVEAQKEESWARTDWEGVLERVVEAYEMSDPVITGFEWPILQ